MSKTKELISLVLLIIVAFASGAILAPSDANAGLKRKGQSKSQAFAQKRCKQTNIVIERGRPVKTRIWDSHCLSYSKARSTRCRVTGVPHYPDYRRVSCVPTMAWMVAINTLDVARLKSPPPCFRESHDHVGSATSVHYNLSWLVNTISKKWAHSSSNVSNCFYFNLGMPASRP